MSKHEPAGQKSPGTTVEPTQNRQRCARCHTTVEMHESPHGRAWCPECRAIQPDAGEADRGGLDGWVLGFSSLGAGGQR